MCINDQYGIDPLPLPWCASFLNRVKARIETSPKVYHARKRGRKLADSFLSKPMQSLPSGNKPAPDQIADAKLGKNKKTINKVIRPWGWPKATNTAVGMVGEGLLNPKQTKSKTKEISRGPIVRYNKRDQRLELQSELEQEKHEEEQQLVQANRGSTVTDDSSAEIENMLSRTYIVKDTIEPQTTREIIQGIGAMLHHVPFTIVGNAALVYYGRNRHISRITLACPEDCTLALFHWAKSNGMHQFVGNGWGDSFGYKTADGGLYRVRVRSLHREPYNTIRLPQPRADNHAKVMALPNIVNDYAGLYANGVRRLSGIKEVHIASDILWMLRRITALVDAGDDDMDQEFTSAEVTWVLTRKFWDPFVRRHPEAVDLFRTAGVFRCLTKDGDTDSSGDPDENRPLPPLPDSVVEASSEENLPMAQDWTEPDGQPAMPHLNNADDHAVTMQEPATAANSRATSVRKPAPADSLRVVSPDYWPNTAGARKVLIGRLRNNVLSGGQNQ